MKIRFSIVAFLVSLLAVSAQAAFTISSTVTGSSTIQNDAIVNQIGTGRGIRDNTAGLPLTVNNNLGALLKTDDADSIQMNKATSNITFNNFGQVISLNASAGGAQAIDWNAITTGSNTLHNFSSSFIEPFAADAVPRLKATTAPA